MDFLEKLDSLLAEKGINRAELAREINVPYTTIMSMYDRGYRNIKLTTLKKLALYFDCTVDYLVSEDNNDRHYKPFDINDLSPSEIKMVESYIRAKNSDQAMVKSLASAIDKLLGVNEPGNE